MFFARRVDTGNPKYQTVNIRKVVGGITPECTDMGRLFYSQAPQTRSRNALKGIHQANIVRL